jgi:hypothetical protein
MDVDADPEDVEAPARREAERLARRYSDQSSSSAKDMLFRVTPLSGSSKAMGTGTLVVPGWVRERASEILFGDAVDEDESIPGLILACILKVGIRTQRDLLLSADSTPTVSDRPPRTHALEHPRHRRHFLPSQLDYSSPRFYLTIPAPSAVRPSRTRRRCTSVRHARSPRQGDSRVEKERGRAVQGFVRSRWEDGDFE